MKIDNLVEFIPYPDFKNYYTGTLKLKEWQDFKCQYKEHYGIEFLKKYRDGEYPITVENGEFEEIAPAKIKAVKYLAENSAKVRDTLFNGLLKELPRLRVVYDYEIPEINKIEDFKQMAGLSQIHIIDTEKEGVAYLGFELACDWDAEHGAGIMMHRDRVIIVDQRDVASDIWNAFEDNGTAEEEAKKYQSDTEKVVKQPTPWWKFW